MAGTPRNGSPRSALSSDPGPGRSARHAPRFPSIHQSASESGWRRQWSSSHGLANDAPRSTVVVANRSNATPPSTASAITATATPSERTPQHTPRPRRASLGPRGEVQAALVVAERYAQVVAVGRDEPGGRRLGDPPRPRDRPRLAER